MTGPGRKRILVVGASGLVARPVIRYLATRGTLRSGVLPALLTQTPGRPSRSWASELFTSILASQTSWSYRVTSTT